MTKVLVTSVGRRRYVVDELVRFAGADDRVLAADMNPLAPGLYASGVQAVPVYGDTPERRALEIQRLISAEKVDAVISLHDFEAIELSRISGQLSEFGCLFIGPTERTSATTLDKVALAQHIESIDPQLTPTTISELSTLIDYVELSKKWVLKDRLGSASSGLQFVDSVDLEHAALQLRPTTWVAQPFTDGVEYNVDVFHDANGDIAGTCTKRKWSMRAGETDSATVTLAAPVQVVNAAIRATEGLDVTGNVDVDVILDNEGSARVIDVNPRFGGGYAFSALAGYEAAKGIWQLARRERVTPLTPTRELTASKHVAVAEVRLC